MSYGSLYERLVANTRREHDNEQACWLWTGYTQHNGYPRVCIRTEAGPRNFQAHRLMLEIVTGYEFPFDEAGHLCFNPSCINPDHLEIQTPAFNAQERRRSYFSPRKDDRMIPILFPIGDSYEDSSLQSQEQSMDLAVACEEWPDHCECCRDILKLYESEAGCAAPF